MSDWAPWSLRDLVTDLETGRTTARDALERSRERIAETEPRTRAWVELDPRPTVSPTGQLRGAPFGVKDIVDLAGFPTRCGSGLRAGRGPAEQDAAVVQAWRRAGATPIGKTVTTEFAYFAPGPTANPAAPGHTPGGSSSGSAASVAAGQVPLAIASQTAGSVTRPASYCGVAAMVLSRGALSTEGVVGLSPSLDSHGIYAARVRDLALAWAAVTGSLDVADAARPPRVLLWSAAELVAVDADMQAGLEQARAALARAGAEVVPLDETGLVADLAAAHRVVMAYEAARVRAAELAAADRLSVPLADLLRTGAATSEDDVAAARAVVSAGAARVDELLGTHDVVLGPAAPGAAPEGLGATGDPVLSRPWQVLGLPVVTVPGLRSPAGLPLGLQVVGRAGGDAAVLAAAEKVEQVVQSR